MRLPVVPSTDEFLHILDTLDGESRVVTHAIVRAQNTLQSLVEELDILLDGGTPDERAWVEFGSRLMLLRSTLIRSVVSLPRVDLDSRPVGSSQAEQLLAPLPPRPRPRPAALDATVAPGSLRRLLSPTAAVAASLPPTITIPDPPRPRRCPPVGLLRVAG